MLKSNDFDSLPKIIAVDFDGTLVEDNYPEIGKINKTLFNDVSVEEMNNLKQTMSKLQKCVEKEE